jgi:HK97 family phage prohead protease
MEVKLLQLSEVHLKSAGDSRTFSGYAATFDSIDSYGDTILPGAFKRTLRGRDRPIRMRWNHFGPVIGLWTAIREDQSGLFVEGELTPGHTVADNVHASMKHGAVDGLSIGYIAKQATKNEHGGRNLREIDLVEISVVEEPADQGAVIGDVKADNLFANETSHSLRTWGDLENYLRNSRQWSRKDAEALIQATRRIATGERKHGDVLRQVAQRLHGVNATARLFGRN